MFPTLTETLNLFRMKVTHINFISSTNWGSTLNVVHYTYNVIYYHLSIGMLFYYNSGTVKWQCKRFNINMYDLPILTSIIFSEPVRWFITLYVSKLVTSLVGPKCSQQAIFDCGVSSSTVE